MSAAKHTPDNVYEAARADLRKQGFSPNPWRIGKCLGEQGVEAPSPYSNALSTRRYTTGQKDGLEKYDRIGQALWKEIREGAWSAGSAA